ncbi:YqhR family membrane protein [Sporotomaculum syntrophicum]|uniref:YqhR family membrane protein n=1 Tax=Sporotomaculum syntrophicum TaxID=182264 RepID=UPI001FABFD02|nr:YqhR family membrane protein [Sporotomaculum syntrophicum]
MEFSDRLTRGFLAGLVGGILMDIISYISLKLKIADLHHSDWPAIILFGHQPTNTIEAVFALLIQLIFVGFLGILFTYLVTGLFSNENYLFKGWLFGVISWFIIYVITFLAKIPELAPLDTGTAITDFIAGSVYGLVLAETIHRLENKVFREI